MSTDDYERTLLQLPQVLVFKIPPRKSADGHKASDWPSTSIWSGKMKIVEKGKIASIILLDNNNQVFAVCPVTDETAVEKTLDSSRYFVLRLVNSQGKKAYIGIAFNERNDAFDFNVTLAEHRAMVERENTVTATEDKLSSFRDLSMKEGEKVTIKLSGATRRERGTNSSANPGVLLPPPGKGNTLKKHETIDPFGDDIFNVNTSSQSTDPFGDFPNNTTTSTTKSTNNNVNLLDL